MAKKLSDEVLKWTIEINGDQARKSLHELDQTTRELEATNKNLKTELSKLEAQGKKNTDEYNSISKSITDNNKVIAQNKERMAALREEIGVTGLTMRQLRSRAKELQNQLDNMIPGTEEYKRLQEDLTQVRGRMDELRISTKGMGKEINSFEQNTEAAQKSLGEMKRELRSLRNMSFAGMDPEQIAKVRERMAELTDEIGDFQAQIRTASADAIPSIINGLQGIVAGVELVTGTMALFGVENENLEKNMVALIGVSQALNEVYKLYEEKTLAVAYATLKKTAATVKDTIAMAANSMAAGAAAAKTAALAAGANSAQVAFSGLVGAVKGLASWLGKVAGGFAATAAAALAVAAAIVGGILLLEKYKNKVDGTTARIEAYNKAVKRSSEVQKEAAEKSASTIVKLQALQRIVNDSTNSEYSRKKALEEVKNETNGVINVTDLSSSSLRKLNAEIKTYISMIQLQAQAEAAYNLAVTAYQDAMKLKASGLDKGTFSTASSALRKQGQEVKALTDDAEEYMNMFNEYTNMANDLLNGFGDNVNRTVEEINSDIKSLNERYAERGMIGGEEEYKRRLKNLQDELATVQKINEEKDAGSSSGVSSSTSMEEFSIENADDNTAENAALDRFNYMIELREREAAEKKRIQAQEDADVQKKIDDEMVRADLQFQTDMQNNAQKNQLRKDMQLMSEQELYDESKKKLDFYLYQKYISEEEHARLLKQLDTDLMQSKIKKWENTLNLTQQIAGSFQSFVQGLMDAELEKAGDNEQKQKAIRKKYADAQFLTSIANMFVNQALGITSIWGQWGAYPIVAGLLTAGLVAATIPQIMVANAQRQKVKQLATGNVTEVIGKDDGKQYKAGFLSKIGTGFYNKPYMALFNENPNRPELVIDSATTHKLKMDYPDVVRTISYVSQHASGKYDAISQQTPNTSASNQVINNNIEVNNQLLAAVNTLNKNIENGIGVNYDKFDKANSDISGIFQKTSL